MKDSTLPIATTATSPAAQPKARKAKGKLSTPAPTLELMSVTTLERAVPSGGSAIAAATAAERTVALGGRRGGVGQRSQPRGHPEGQAAAKGGLCRLRARAARAQLLGARCTADFKCYWLLRTRRWAAGGSFVAIGMEPAWASKVGLSTCPRVIAS